MRQLVFNRIYCTWRVDAVFHAKWPVTNQHPFKWSPAPYNKWKQTKRKWAPFLPCDRIWTTASKETATNNNSIPWDDLRNIVAGQSHGPVARSDSERARDLDQTAQCSTRSKQQQEARFKSFNTCPKWCHWRTAGTVSDRIQPNTDAYPTVTPACIS